MDINRTEEETVEHLKQWLRENGMAVILGVIIGLSAIVGVRFWFTHTQTQAEKASLIYDEVASALAAKNYVNVMQQGKQLMDNYGGTSYAVLGALAMAKASLAMGDATTAREDLAWVLANADDKAMQHIARIRLARLFVDAKDYTAAMKLITDQPQGAFGSLYEELRGDILTAQGNMDLAREAYRQALVSTKDGSRRQFLQMKLDNLTTAIQPAATASPDVNQK